MTKGGEMSAPTTPPDEVYRLRRQLWFQNELIAALADDQPVQSLMARLGQLVRGTAALYDESGHIAACVGDGPLRLIWQELEHRDRQAHRFGMGRYDVLAGPVVMRGSGYWVALASRYPATVKEIGEPLLESTQRMLSVMRGARSLGRTQEQAHARHLLTVLSAEVTADRVPALWRRLRELRFTPNHPVRTVVAVRVTRPGTPLQSPRARADHLEAMHEIAYLEGLPLVLADHPADSPSGEPSLLALAADEPEFIYWCARLARTHVVGVSEPIVDLSRAAAAFRDARMAVRVGLAEPWDQTAPHAIVRFEDVDLATWLLSSRPGGEVDARVARILGPLLEREELLETLVTHLALELDVRLTAEALFLHPNSVRYRLRRIEELLGGPLSSPRVLANCYLALHKRLMLANELNDARRVEGGRADP